MDERELIDKYFKRRHFPPSKIIIIIIIVTGERDGKMFGEIGEKSWQNYNNEGVGGRGDWSAVNYRT